MGLCCERIKCICGGSEIEHISLMMMMLKKGFTTDLSLVRCNSKNVAPFMRCSISEMMMVVMIVVTLKMALAQESLCTAEVCASGQCFFFGDSDVIDCCCDGQCVQAGDCCVNFELQCVLGLDNPPFAPPPSNITSPSPPPPPPPSPPPSPPSPPPPPNPPPSPPSPPPPPPIANGGGVQTCFKRSYFCFFIPCVPYACPSPPSPPPPMPPNSPPPVPPPAPPSITVVRVQEWIPSQLGTPDVCVFPFDLDGQTYTDCVEAAGVEWCLNAEGVWGTCLAL